jgi:hypothetical protein
MPDPNPDKPDSTLEELLAKSKELADRAKQASDDFNRIVSEMEENARQIEQQMKRRRRTVN